MFERLKGDAARGFFCAAFRQVLAEQCRRFSDRHLAATLENFKNVFQRVIIKDGSVPPLHRSLADSGGKRVDLLRCLRKTGSEGRDIYQAQVKVGRAPPVEGRVVAAKIDPVKAAERKRRLRKNCKEAGKLSYPAATMTTPTAIVTMPTALPRSTRSP